MNLYLQRLLDERDNLTRSATSITDTAARAERDVTETEAGSLAAMATRCAEIDGQVSIYQGQQASARAYAGLRSSVLDADEREDDSGGGGTTTAVATRSATLETREIDDDSFGATFEQRAPEIFAAWSGQGRSAPVELGSCLDERAVITTAEVGGAVEKVRRIPTPPAYSSPLLALVNVVPVASGVIEWLRFGPNPGSEAKEVAEGALKLEADFEFALNEDKLKTFAHWKAATRQALDDVSSLRSMIENRLRVGLQRKLATEVGDVLNADADIPTLAAATLLAGIRVAMGTFDDESGYAATGVALNPLDWAQLDIDSLGQTLQGPVRNTGAWGLRFASSSRIPAGTAFVGDFGSALTLFDRRVTNVFASDSHADFFIRNQIIVLAETRALAVVEEPAALIKVTIGDEAGGGGGTVAADVTEKVG